MNNLRAALTEGTDFVYTCELIPGRGHLGKSVDHIEQFVSTVKSLPEVKALSITDNAGGNPALLPDVLGIEILNQDIDIIVHFACKDMNRNSIESRAFALQRRGVPSQFLYFPDENHWILKPANSVLWHETVLGWLDKWVKRVN